MSVFAGVEKSIPEYALAKNHQESQANVDLFNAAEQGNLKSVKAAVANGATPLFFYHPEDQKNSLHVASQGGHLEVVKLLAGKGANVNFKKPRQHTTPLYIASQNGHFDVVKWLVEKGGADLNIAETFFGQTPLYIAAKKGFTEIVELLVLNGANIDKKNLDGHTPRDAAYADGHYDLAWWLDALNETRATNQMLKSRSAANK